MPGGYHSSTKPGSAQLEVPTRIRPATRLRLHDRVFVTREQQLGHLGESVRPRPGGLEDPYDVKAIAWPGLRYLRVPLHDRVRDHVDRLVLPADQRHAAGGQPHVVAEIRLMAFLVGGVRRKP